MNANNFLEKTTIVELFLGDLEFIKDSKVKLIEESFNKDIDTIMEEISQEEKIKLSDKIYVSVFPDINFNDAYILFGIQSLVNQGYKHIYKSTDNVNFWIK